MKYAPEPILEMKTRRVRGIDSSVRKLVGDMIETMHANCGVGLAANQVGVPLRIAVIQLPDDERATILINPQVLSRDGYRELDEGCLSIPGYQGLVKRSAVVKVRALDLDGRVIRIKAENDLLAQALEHETDHLNGNLYIQHLVSSDQLWKVSDRSGKDQETDGAIEGDLSHD